MTIRELGLEKGVAEYALLARLRGLPRSCDNLLPIRSFGMPFVSPLDAAGF